MKLGYHYHIPFSRQGDNLFTRGYQGVFLDSLASECEQLICFMHSACRYEVDEMDYQLKSTNIEFIDIGSHTKVWKRLCTFEKVKDAIRRKKSGIDALLVRCPTPLLSTIANAAMPVPVSYLVVGDYIRSFTGQNQSWYKKMLIHAWIRWNKMQQNKALKTRLVFTNNIDIQNEYQKIARKVIKVSTSLIRESDIVSRPRNYQKKPLRLLYVGRVTDQKGPTDLIKALNLLLIEGVDVVLDIVGESDPNDRTLDLLNDCIENLNLTDKVFYHGYLSHGPELFSIYEKADIYVMCSRTNEGFPRTIWEAMAHELPVISTRVGTIESELTDAALFVEPNNPQGIKSAVVKLLQDADLRQKICRNAMRKVSQSTLERQCSTLIQEIQQSLELEK